MDTTLVGGAADDTYRADQSTLTAGDQLNGGAGTDTLQITTTAAATIGGAARSDSVETVTATATLGDLEVQMGNFSGVTTVGSSGSTSNVAFSGLTAIPAVNVAGTAGNVTVSTSAAAVAGTADSATITLNSATGAASNGQIVTFNGIETINLVAAGASGSADAVGTSNGRGTTITSDALTALNITGTAGVRVATTLASTATVTGTVTSAEGADDVTVTAPAASKVSVSMGAGNDTVRIGTNAPGVLAATPTVGGWTIAGGDGTDTLVTAVTVSPVTTASANISGFEAVRISGGSPTVALSPTTNTISTVTFDVGAGSVAGVAAGATVNVNAAGTATVTNATGWTGAGDAITFNVGNSTTNAPFGATTLSADLIETVTVNNVARAGNTDARTITIDGTTTKTLTINANGALTLTAAQTTLTTVNAGSVAGDLTFNTSAAAASITGGAGNDTLGTAATASGADTIDGGAGNDTINGGAGADSLIGGLGADSITGGTGADTMTGGDGVDRFVFSANNTTAVPAVNVSTAQAPDTITDFVSGTDKISGTGAVAFLGNFTNIQAALARQAQAGTLANSAAFVQSENALYVFQNRDGTLNVNDIVIRLTNVTTLAEGDLLLGSMAGGNSVALSATLVNPTSVGTTGTSTGVATTSASTNTTDLNDTVSASTTLNIVSTSIVNGGAGSDTLALTIGGSTTADDGILSTGDLANFTGFETITLADRSQTAASTVYWNVSINNTQIADNSTLTITLNENGLDSVGVAPAAGAANIVTAAAVTGTGRTVSITGGSGSDSLVGGANNDTISGADGNDEITAGSGNDSLSGGNGNDTFVLSTNLTAGDTISGGAGTAGNTDVITFTNPAAAAATMVDNVTGVETFTYTPVTADGTAAGQRAVNVITATASSAFAADGATRAITVAANFATVLDFTNVTAGSLSITGGTGADVITGSNTLGDTIDGGATGQDTIRGLGGNDRLVVSAAASFDADGGSGDDTFVGGTGITDADTLVGGAGNDTLTLAGDYDGGGGALAVLSTNSLFSGIETITLGSQTPSATATGFDYSITVDAGNDPDSTVTTDTLTVDGSALSADVDTDAGDTAEENMLFSAATVTAFRVSVTGGAGVDTITGSSLADTINGGAGADIIDGGAGNDTITPGAGADASVTPGQGNDTINLTEATSAADTIRFAEAGAAHVDSVTGFVVGTDVIAIIDNSTATSLVAPGLLLGGNITWSGTNGTDVVAGGGGTTQVFVTAAANAGTVDASAAQGVIKFTTAATSFATAIGTTSITTHANLSAGEVVLVTWYDSAAGQMVVGFVNASADGTATNITQNDLFVEVVRVGMTASDYGAFTIAGLAPFAG